MTLRETSTIDKLNDTNYPLWKFKVEMILIKEDLQDHLTQDPPDPANTEWTKKDNKARALINLFIEDSQIIHVKHLTTAKQTWQALRAVHQRKNLSSKLYLLRKLYSLRLDEKGDMNQHINKILEIIDRLKAIGENIEDSHISALMLCSVPQSYDTLVTALEARPEEELTPELIRNKLIDEHNRRAENNHIYENSTRAFQTHKKFNNFKRESKYCSYCKMKNHNRQECWHLNKSRDNRNNQNKSYRLKNNSNSSSLAFQNNQTSENRNIYNNNKSEKPPERKMKNLALCAGIAPKDTWIIDSGSSSHITNNENLFEKFSNTEKTQVIIANGNAVTSYGSGDISFKTITSDGTTNNITLKDVLFVPEIETNLLSVKQATKTGCKITFQKNKCELTYEGKLYLEAHAKNNLYEATLHTNKIKHYAAITQECTSQNCITLWHRRLGHRDITAIKLLMSEQLADGININHCKHDINCEDCIKAKMSNMPYPKAAQNKGTRILERIHTDICGPMPVPTLGGKRYLLTFIDEFSRYTTIYLLAKKNEVTEKFKEFISHVSNKFGKLPENLRSDNGGEYENNDFNDYLKTLGIHHELTVPYCSAQNAIAERKNRSLIEMTRTMLSEAKLNTSLWGEAVNTANYLQNRLPTKATDKTPYEIWHNRKPDLSNIKVFGCKVFAYIDKSKRNKLSNTAEQGIFVGYDSNSKGYRICTEGKYVSVARTVKFMEHSSLESETADTYTQISDTLDNPSTEETHEKHSITIETNESEKGTENTLSDSSVQPIGAQPRRSDRTNKGVPPDRLIYLTHQKITEPESYSDFLKINNPSDKENWQKAMNEEINSLKQNNTYTLVDAPPGRKIIGCKWTYKIKRDTEGNIARYKARLVAKGFSQKYGEDYHETFAPVVSHATIRAFLVAAAHRKMEVRHIDIKTAFLHGELEECVYMQQPDGYIEEGSETKVCKMQKAIYGLKQAARAWHLKIGDTLKNLNFVQSTSDQCLYTRKENSETVYIIVYVDDLLISGPDTDIDKIISQLGEEYELKDLGQVNYYLGINIARNKEGHFLLNQRNKIDDLVEKLHLQEAKNYSTPMDAGYLSNNSDENLLPNNKQYRMAIGALLYIATITRPDIAAATSILSRRNEKPRQADWNAVKRLISYLNTTKDLALILKTNEKPTLTAYADADWAGDKNDRKSTSGNIFFLGDSPINWISKKQTCVALSSAEAEYISAGNATQEIRWLINLLNDLGIEHKNPILLFEDNQSCMKMAQSPKYITKTKHVDIKYHAIRDMIQEGIIELKYLPSKNMVADILTKPLPKPDFVRHRNRLFE